MHSLWSSMRACRKTPSAHTYTYRRADRSRFCQRSYSLCHSVVSLETTDFDGADPRLDRPHWTMAVPHEAVAAVGKLQALHRGEKRLGFHLDSLRKQLPSTRSQNIRQWIVDLIGLTQWDNVAMLVHGVSLSLRGSGRLDTRLDTPPISFRHHPVSRIAHSTIPAWPIRTRWAYIPMVSMYGFTRRS